MLVGRDDARRRCNVLGLVLRPPSSWQQVGVELAGLRSTVERSPCVDRPSGARYEVKATVHVPSSNRGMIKTLQIFGYFGSGDSAGQRRAFERMLATATHQ